MSYHPRMIALRPAALAALAGLIAAGCARRIPPPPPLPPVDPPRLTIEAVAPGAIDAFGVTVLVRGRLENPNPVDLPVSGFDYAVEVDGQAADSGRLDSQLVLPAAGAVDFAVPARLRWSRIPETVVVLATRRSLALRVTGAARLRGVRPLPWGAEATVALPILPSLALERSRVRESTLLQTTLELALRIRNPNDFPLPVGRLRFDLSVSGSVVASAASHALDQVAPHGEVEVLIPVKFSPIGTVAAAVGGVLKLQANVHLVGQAGWGELEVAVDQKIGL
jgi:LEA14-like dessication related protein